MRKKYKVVLVICFIFTLIVMASTTHVEAMTGSVAASVGKTNLSVGESTKLTVLIQDMRKQIVRHIL